MAKGKIIPLTYRSQEGSAYRARGYPDDASAHYLSP